MNKKKCNCYNCAPPSFRLVELEDRSIIGILYETSGGITIVGIGEGDDADDDDALELNAPRKRRRRRRLKSAFKALKNAGQQTVQLGLRSAIPAPEAINTLRRINRTRADLETLSELGVNETAPVESVNGIDRTAIDLYRGANK